MDRFSVRLERERPFREPSEDEMADYKEQEVERMIERMNRRFIDSQDPAYKDPDKQENDEGEEGYGTT